MRSEERHFNSEALLYSRAAAVAAGVPFPLSQWMPLGKSGFVARAAASLPFFGPFRAQQAHASAAPIPLLSTIRRTAAALDPLSPALSISIHPESTSGSAAGVPDPLLGQLRGAGQVRERPVAAPTGSRSAASASSASSQLWL